jgi:hypothetical protein
MRVGGFIRRWMVVKGPGRRALQQTFIYRGTSGRIYYTYGVDD